MEPEITTHESQRVPRRNSLKFIINTPQRTISSVIKFGHRQSLAMTSPKLCQNSVTRRRHFYGEFDTLRPKHRTTQKRLTSFSTLRLGYTIMPPVLVYSAPNENGYSLALPSLSSRYRKNELFGDKTIEVSLSPKDFRYASIDL